MLGGIEDAPLDVVAHGLELGHPGLPPFATNIGGHSVALLHEEGEGPVEPDGPEDLVQEGAL